MGQNVGQLLTLPLGADVRAEASLQELERTLILRHLQQLHTALLVRGMADHLTHQVAHELGVLGLDLEEWTKRRLAYTIFFTYNVGLSWGLWNKRQNQILTRLYDLANHANEAVPIKHWAASSR